MFESLMDNYQRVEDLAKAGENSFGALAEANQKRVEQLEARINVLKDKMLAFTDALQPLIFGSVELGNTLLDLVNSFGAIPTVVGLASASLLNFTERGKSLRDVLINLASSNFQFVEGLASSVAQHKNSAETYKNMIALKQQSIASIMQEIEELRINSAENSKNAETIVKKQGELKKLNLGLINNQKQLAMATLKATAFQAALSFGLSVAISGAIMLIGKMVEELKDFAWSSDEAKEALGSMQESLEEYNELQTKTKETEKEIASLKSINEKIKDNTDAYNEQEGLIDTIQEKLEGLAVSYPSMASVLKSDNLELETKIKLLERQLELEEKQASMKAMQDLGGNVAQKIENGIKEQMDDIEYAKDTLDLINKGKIDVGQIDSANQMIEEAKIEIEALLLQSEVAKATLETALSHGFITEEYYRNQVEKLDATIEKYKEYGSGVRDTTEDVKNNTRDIVETAINSIASLSDTLATDFDSETASSSLAVLKGSLSELEEDSDEAKEVLTKLRSTFSDMPDDVDTLADAIDYLNGKFEETSEVADMKDLNESYLNALKDAKEAKELLESFKDGLDLDEKFAIFDSDLMKGYNGSIEDSASIQEHLNNKIAEMEDISNKAYAQMMANDKSFWSEKMKNSQEWATFEAGLQQSVTQLGAEMLGIQEQDFADYIDSKGGMRSIDLTNAETMNEAEGMVNVGMLNQMMDWYEDYINEKGGSRKVDMSNVIEFLNKQGENEVLTINQLAQKWSEFYNDKKKAIQANARELSTLMNSQLSKLEASDFPVYDKYDMGYYDAKTNEVFGTLSKDVKALQDAANAMENYFAETSYTFDKLSDTVKQSSADFDKLTKPNSNKGSSSSSDKGSSSSSKDTEKEVANLELEIDRYYKLNDAIRDLENSLSMLQAKREQITTKDAYKKSIEEEIALINKQITAQQNLLKEQQKERNEIKSTLSKNGFKFDSKTGNITNYATQLKKLQDAANKKSGEAKEVAIAQVEALADLIDKYNELNDDTIPNTSVEIQNLKNEIVNLNKELEENMKAIEKMGDRYFYITSKIAKVDNTLSMNQALQETANDERKIELMKEQINLIKQRQELVKQEQNEAKQEQTELKAQLAQKGVTFNSSGQVANYEGLIRSLESKANSLVGDAQSEAVEEIEELLDLIEKYTELTDDTIPGLELSWQEYVNEMQSVQDAIDDIYQQQKENAVQTQKDIASAYEKYLTERYNKLKDALNKEQEAYNKAYDEENFQRDLSKQQRALDEIAQQIAIYERDTSAVGQTRLEQLRKEYEEQQEAINDMIREQEKSKTDEAFAEASESLDEELENALSPENVANIVNQALATGFVTIGDSVVELNGLMTQWLDETGDGLYLLGDTIKSEMIDNLQQARDLIKELDSSSSWSKMIGLASVNSSNLGKAAPQSISFAFNQPLVNVEGNADSDVLDTISGQITSQINSMEQRIYQEIKNVLT